ncbi:acyl-CoA dehydrogenase [Stakelama tenebrarum]|uniref:Acyl-coenzyme A dehydrogenase n=1 Tax=Stakelama tenebrarum TaxID=2711215 RepID=A0A6G6Y5J5_9SPHN|nr:acyl-CoA dehydrogenase [Sphingosinithalassobacter tenebrarum]QIG80180.1 acyl-CoA dehydrogenase [Sphingosinithalassobacter tenebrarum]
MLETLRRNLLSKPIFQWARGSLPSLSATEREAMEAGDTWWDADLFSGAPDWEKMRDMAPASLTQEEQAFIDGPVAQLCDMLDDWQIAAVDMDLPETVWDFLKKNKFFGMIIPKDYGGLGFSAFAHSEVVKRISTRSVTAAVTVMVPNSLGPGELLLQFGRDDQKDHYLPRLADGREIPCFALTSDEAGSDASAMVDHGVVCKQTIDGEEVLGMSITFSKRYITLAPVATVLGLAFKLTDPDHLLSDEEDRGITVALVPTDTPGVEHGRRHLPSMQAFQNGPVSGKDVFVPLDAIIGGQEQIGQGWKMLMAALAAGRGISLPSLATAAACAAARTTGAYARVREQFGIPIGKFEGVKERLGRIAGIAYELEAARRFTCAGLDQGHHPSIVSAIMKAHATYRMRQAVDDTMDVHGGKTIIDGPKNYFGNVYRSVPVGITVEGANIVTRSLIIFGQGAMRDHPYLLKEVVALEEQGKDALVAFDEVLWKHAGHIIKNLASSFASGWTGGATGDAPDAGKVKGYYKQLSRYASALATCAEVALISLGGTLKRKEAISARYGDILAELYLLSAVLKRWEDDGRLEEDLPLVEWACETGFQRIEDRFDAIFVNFPVPMLDKVMRAVTLPFRSHPRGPSDDVIFACADTILSSGAQRDRIACGVHVGPGPVADLEHALDLVERTQRLRDKRKHQGEDALNDAEREALQEAAEAVATVVAVDDFDSNDLRGLVAPQEEQVPSPDQPDLKLVQSI